MLPAPPGPRPTGRPSKHRAWRSSSPGTTSLDRLGGPDDVADVVAFLATDAARWITGQVIDASGGLFLGPRV
nr:SDR family oxidoreductase [Streptomyces sp. A108]